MEGGIIVGAPGQSGYGSWPTMEAGFAAGQRRLFDYIQFGHNGKPGDTIENLGKFYATDPRWSETVAEYAAPLKIDEKLATADNIQMRRLMRGILMAEWGGVTGKAQVVALIDKYGPSVTAMQIPVPSTVPVGGQMNPLIAELLPVFIQVLPALLNTLAQITEAIGKQAAAQTPASSNVSLHPDQLQAMIEQLTKALAAQQTAK